MLRREETWLYMNIRSLYHNSQIVLWSVPGNMWSLLQVTCYLVLTQLGRVCGLIVPFSWKRRLGIMKVKYLAQSLCIKWNNWVINPWYHAAFLWVFLQVLTKTPVPLLPEGRRAFTALAIPLRDMSVREGGMCTSGHYRTSPHAIKKLVKSWSQLSSTSMLDSVVTVSSQAQKSNFNMTVCGRNLTMLNVLTNILKYIL